MIDFYSLACYKLIDNKIIILIEKTLDSNRLTLRKGGGEWVYLKITI